MTLRKCQPCTACCDGYLDLGDDLLISKKTGSCINCINSGCNIYVSRPKEPCQSFECLWLIDGSPLPIWMRPDQSRVIVTFSKFNQNDEIVMVDLRMDATIPQKTLIWLNEYATKYRVPLVLISNQKKFSFVAQPINLALSPLGFLTSSQV
jgi:hypothetical protein